MSWRKVEVEDLVATLSSAEIDTYKNSSEFVTDPIEKLIQRSVSQVRSYIRAANVLIPQDETMLPESLINIAMDITAWNILKRINVPISDDRKLSWQKSMDILNSVANKQLSIEKYEPEEGEDPEISTTVLPSYNERIPPYRLD